MVTSATLFLFNAIAFSLPSYPERLFKQHVFGFVFFRLQKILVDDCDHCRLLFVQVLSYAAWQAVSPCSNDSDEDPGAEEVIAEENNTLVPSEDD